LINKNEYAPIALFVYNRPEHTQHTIEALAKNIIADKSELFIFSDAAKISSDQAAVEKVRSYVRDIKGFSAVNVIERERNLGLANSIIDGVTQLCEQFGRVIVLEDDLETAPYFLTFINTALNMFRYEEHIGAVSGYMYPINVSGQVFLRNVPQSWGWGTWNRSWELMETDGAKLLEKLEHTRTAESFNKAGHQPFLKMLKDQIRGKNNSWYVRWSASLFLNQKLTLMPHKSLVRNIGIDGTGTHCAYWRFNPYDVEITKDQVNIPANANISVDSAIEFRLSRYFWKVRFIRYVNFFYRILRSGSHRIWMKR